MPASACAAAILHPDAQHRPGPGRLRGTSGGATMLAWRNAAPRSRPRLQLVPARRASPRRSAGGSARTRSTRPCASARAWRRRRARRGGDRARAGGDRGLRALLRAPRARARRRRRSGDERDPRRARTRRVPGAGRAATGLPVRVLSPGGGGALRLPRRRELDDAGRRRGRSTSAAAACSSSTWATGRPRARSLAARRRAHDRALPARPRAAKRKQLAGAARRTSPSALDRRAVDRAAPTGSSASAARCGPRRGGPARGGVAEFGVQGFVVTRDALDALIDELAALPPPSACDPRHQAVARATSSSPARPWS